jgi:hypothetical protein
MKTGHSPELGRLPFWERPSRALPDPECCPGDSADLKTAACSQVTGLCNQGVLARFNGQSRNSGWYAGGGFDYMVHKGPLVDVLLGVEYQHFDVGTKNAFCFNPGCNPATGWDEDLSAKGDIVRARLTIKTSGYRFFY